MGLFKIAVIIFLLGIAGLFIFQINFIIERDNKFLQNPLLSSAEQYNLENCSCVMGQQVVYFNTTTIWIALKNKGSSTFGNMSELLEELEKVINVNGTGN